MKRRISNNEDSNWYECKTCGKKFDTFQALGGHQGSHRKVRPIDDGDGCELRLQIGSEPTSGVLQLHQCKLCTKKFETGQALGGHMRRHKIEKDLILMERRPLAEAEEKLGSDLVVGDVKPRRQKAEEEDDRKQHMARMELVLAAKELRLAI